MTDNTIGKYGQGTYGGTGTQFSSFNPLSIITNLISAGINLWTNYKNNETQKAINKANITAQQKENEITRSREDNAHVREVADLENAGLSPLAATAGANASSGGVMTAEAPQMDTASMIDALARISSEGLEAERIKEEKRKNRATENESTAMRMQQQEQFEKSQELTEKLQGDQIKAEAENVNKQLKQRADEMENEEKARAYNDLVKVQEESRATYNDLNDQFGAALPFHIVTDVNTYHSELNGFMDSWNNFLEWATEDDTSGTNPNVNLIERKGGFEVNRSENKGSSGSVMGSGISGQKGESNLGNINQTAQLSILYKEYRNRTGNKASLNFPLYQVPYSEYKKNH